MDKELFLKTIKESFVGWKDILKFLSMFIMELNGRNLEDLAKILSRFKDNIKNRTGYLSCLTETIKHLEDKGDFELAKRIKFIRDDNTYIIYANSKKKDKNE